MSYIQEQQQHYSLPHLLIIVWCLAKSALGQKMSSEYYVSIYLLLYAMDGSLSLLLHSSQFRSLCSMKSSSEMLQNLLYVIYKKTHVVFFHFSFCATLYFYLMNALVYVNIDQGIHWEKIK